MSDSSLASRVASRFAESSARAAAGDADLKKVEAEVEKGNKEFRDAMHTLAGALGKLVKLAPKETHAELSKMRQATDAAHAAFMEQWRHFYTHR
jgi:hypothetical protein